MANMQNTPGLTTRSTSRRGAIRQHELPRCRATGLLRYRDRHQARHGVEAADAGSRDSQFHTFSCPDCRGYHVEQTHYREPITPMLGPAPAEVFTASLAARKRRYILVDIENPTCGAKATPSEVAAFWNVLKQQAPGLAPHDHIVIGASRMVVRKYRAAIDGPNIKWVVGADAPDGADRTLLAAIDLRQVARKYDELLIVSGDHAFTDLAYRAKAVGLTVHVITAQHPSQRSMLSGALSEAADLHTVVRLRPRPPKPKKAQPTPVVARQAMRLIFESATAA